MYRDIIEAGMFLTTNTQDIGLHLLIGTSATITVVSTVVAGNIVEKKINPIFKLIPLNVMTQTGKKKLPLTQFV
jgi:hypothetical protein